MLKLGDLDQRIEFFEEQSIQDDSGNYVVTSVSVLKTFAKIEQLKQSRKLEDAQLKFPSTYNVTILNRDGFFPNTNMVIKWRNDTYNITSTPEIEDVRVQKFYSFIISK
ncbi:MAG TPA: phage head closure protein [Paludibacteraceae bacterium]|nr:phage head closure protein [Paludibacteraceae bacterium]